MRLVAAENSNANDPLLPPRIGPQLQGRARADIDRRAVRAASGRSQSAARRAPDRFPPRIDVRRSAGARSTRTASRSASRTRSSITSRAATRARRRDAGRADARARMARVGSEPHRDEPAAPAFLAPLHAGRRGARSVLDRPHACRSRPARARASRRTLSSSAPRRRSPTSHAAATCSGPTRPRSISRHGRRSRHGSDASVRCRAGKRRMICSKIASRSVPEPAHDPAPPAARPLRRRRSLRSPAADSICARKRIFRRA